ncbi:MAG: recombinase family protein [Lachnospiraceae bacterium]
MARTKERYQKAETDYKWPSLPVFSAGIYSRVSVGNGENKTETIENQIEIAKQFVMENNSSMEREMEIKIYDIYIDRGITGTSFDRKGFMRLMEDVKRHKINCIIVKDLSRFGRDYIETGNYIEKILPFLGCRFIAVTDGFDSMYANAAENQLTMNIKNLVNDMYAKDISKRSALAKKMAAQAGSYIGSFAPYGYNVVNINGIRKLIVDNECAGIIRLIFEKYAGGCSYNNIISYLYTNKIHRISGYKKYHHVYCESGEILHQWGQNVIRGLLSNIVYTGSLVQCKRSTGLYKGQKKILKTSEDEWVTARNTHEAVISKELFEKVQNRLKKTVKSAPVKYTDKETDNIYRNILYCGVCGKRMHPVFYGCRGKDERHFSYYCRNAYIIDGRKCGKNYIREKYLDICVMEQLKYVLKSQKIKIKDCIQVNNFLCSQKITAYMEEEKELFRTCERIKEECALKFMQYKEGKATKEEYMQSRQYKKEQEGFSEKRRAELKKKIQDCKLQTEEKNQFLENILKAGKYQKLDIYLAEALIDSIFIFPDGIIEIYYKFTDGGVQAGK